ncbi:hypothetical protein [Bacillus sp. FJAT-49736]|uniref:hypothetical protein n=1 Tax=Bacillus sp. FJAT-49736 TaxID=2833582 RepID=UPI001BCA3886|nr:hypothetical protein [Bacillus sp. FJAT-49736]MBS4172916.1 hypothetical protein [Bacillus sp. FJAT-49736]
MKYGAIFKKERKDNEKSDSRIKSIMEGLEDPNWLIEDIVQLLESKRQTLSDEIIHKWLNDLGNQEGFDIPAEFQNEQKLLDIYESYSGWVKEQIQFYEEVTYEPFDKHAENLPIEIK